MRRWLQRIGLGLLALAALWLLAVNLFLNTPLASETFNRRPDRFRIDWRVAWCVLPGHVHARGLRLESRSSHREWTLTAERARARIDLGALFRRTLRVSELRAAGVRSELVSRAVPERSSPPRRRTVRSRPWSLRFEAIDLEQVRLLRFGDVRLTGDGRAEGAFRLVPGGELQLQRSRLRMRRARVTSKGRELSKGLDLSAEATLGPYTPRLHRGVAGWDFLSGTLTLRGSIDDLWLLAKAESRSRPRPGSVVADLRIARGRLLPPSRVLLLAPSRAPSSALRFAAEVGPDLALPRLQLDIDARGVAGGHNLAGTPVIRIDGLTVAASTPETRVGSLIASRPGREVKPDQAATLPLQGEVRATGVHLDAPSSRLTLRGTLDHVAGRIDLGALLRREVAVDDLDVKGAAIHLDLLPPQAGPPAPPSDRAAWAVRIADARLAGIREIAMGDLVLAGDGTATTALSLSGDGMLSVAHASVEMPTGRFEVGGAPVAHDLAVKVKAKLAPVRTGPGRRPNLLRATSGTATLRGQVDSLGFLEPYLQKTPWLAIDGKGALTADLRLEEGRFATGSRLAVTGTPVETTILASRASGRGTVEVAVEPRSAGGPAGPQTAMRVRVERFVLADLRHPRQPPYLRGSGLRVTAVAPAAVDLVHPVQDFDATLDLPDGELPDLAVYGALLPADAGLAILGGRGRARLHLQTSTRARRVTGRVSLRANDARLRFQDLEVMGRLTLEAPLSTPDLTSHRFDLTGARVGLEAASYRSLSGQPGAVTGPWWARAELTGGTLVWGDPISLRGTARLRLRDSGPLLALFSNRSRLVRWFDDALRVEDVQAEGALRLDAGLVAIDSLRATGGALELRSRMRFEKDRRRGDLYIRYGRLAAGIALRDGQRDVVLRRPLEWFLGGGGATP